MASAFANAGMGQFGQDSNYQAGAGGGGFLAGLAVQKSGLEDYLNKNLGVSYAGGKLSAFKQPEGSVAPDVNPYANTGMPANQIGAVPPTVNPANSNNVLMPTTQNPSTAQIPVANYDSMPGALDAGKNLGHDILNNGKSSIAALFGG